MFAVLAHPAFARLYAAQVIALVGTGLLTVALGLLAYDLAGARAGEVLGTALAIKMVAYVGLSPLAHAAAARLPRRAVLIGADLVRAAAALSLPFIDAVWQVYLAIFVLQAASAAFTPAFQAVIPDILPDEARYTRALSLSRLAYEIESLASPTLAALLLTVMSFHWLFAGTVIGFLASALLVRLTLIPEAREEPRPFLDRVTRGMRIYLATPRLRGLLALCMATAAAGAFVLVNTVVVVKSGYGGTDSGLAGALAAYGGGAMLAALTLPRLLDRLPDRVAMLPAAAALGALTLAAGLWAALAGLPPWPAFLMVWAAMGALSAAVMTPSGRLLRRSAHAADRPAVFAAQFALSHACWLVTYPLAGWAGPVLGLGWTLALLGFVALAAAFAAWRLWPVSGEAEIAHEHPGLAPGHPHLAGDGGGPHRHPVVIDALHPAWPGARRA